jgi:predicted nucleotidyltransferase
MNAALTEHLRIVRPLLERIEAEYRPTQVWLFGSRAQSAAGLHSDWDFLVVVPDEADEAALDPMRAWRTQKAAGVAADIVVCTESDFRDDRETVNTIGYIVARNGIRVFERGAADRE